MGKGNKLNYYPIQPKLDTISNHSKDYMELSMMNNHNILLFYQFKIDPFDFPFVFPDGCIEIIFCCNPNNPTATIYGSLLNSRQIHFEPDYEHFAVRFLPEQITTLMSYPIKELTDREVPLSEYISLDRFIVEKICEAESFIERMMLFKEYINTNTVIEHAPPEFVEYCVKEIYRYKGNITIKDLVQKTGYSDRYLRKKFEEFIGMSPKLFCQIIRVQNSLQILTNRNENLYDDVIYELGYFDQSHFIEEFKKFNILTPTKIKKLIT